jgi:hypothetical protein
VSSLTALPFRGRGIQRHLRQEVYRVTKQLVSGSVLERRAVEGESPVHENLLSLSGHPSSTGTVKVGVNLRRPLRKAKYF